MFNHLRTLLLNVSGSQIDAKDPGGELVPAGYLALALPTYLTTLRAQLFGVDPDIVMLNYRARQLLTILHSTELVEFVTGLDPRITYDVHGPSSLFEGDFGITVHDLSENPRPLYVNGTPVASSRGRCQQSWRLQTDGASLVITQLMAPAGTSQIVVTATDGLSQPINLIGSPLSIQFQIAASNAPADEAGLWTVTALGRPNLDLGVIAATIRGIGEPVLDALFGVGSSLATNEPFKTFRNLWYDHPELAYQLGGLVLAMGYRTEQVRTNA